MPQDEGGDAGGDAGGEAGEIQGRNRHVFIVYLYDSLKIKSPLLFPSIRDFDYGISNDLIEFRT